MQTRTYSHVVGFDDSPFPPEHRGNVPVVGAVYSGLQLDGVLYGRVRRDGADSTRKLAALIVGSKFYAQLQLILLQGIAMAGFNVIDAEALHQITKLPVMAVTRRRPRMHLIRTALLNYVPGGKRKWRIIERLGPVEPVAGVYAHCTGLTLTQAGQVIRRLAVHSRIPEPLRTAHLIAGAIATGQSRGRT